MIDKKITEIKKSGDTWRWAILLALAAVLVLAASIYPASDPDLYIMLATGRYVTQTGHAPTADQWSSTAFGRPWQMHEWFSSLIFYLLFANWGINGIILFKAFLLVGAFLLAMITMKIKGVSPEVSLVVSLLALLASNFGFAERIQIFVFFFLVLLLFWMEMNRSGKVSYKYFLPGIILLMVLWANVHMTNVFGVFIIGLYLFDDMIIAFKDRSWRKLVEPSITFISSFAAIGINPYGFYNVWLSMTYYFRPELQAADAKIYTSILEYQPLLSPGFSREPLVVYGLVWICFSFLGILLGWKRLRFSFFVLWALFTYWAFGYMRFLWLQIFITMIGIGYHWQGAADYILNKFRKRIPAIKIKPGLLFLTLVIAALCGAGLFQRSGKHLWQRVRLGWKPRMYSDQGADFLSKYRRGGKVFNDFDIGGYLLWKQIPVFVDGRIGPYFGTEIMQDHFKISGGDLILLDRYGIDWIFLPYAKTSQTEEFDRFNSIIISSGIWALVYWDDAGLIYVRRTPLYSDVIGKYEYRYVNPAVPNLNAESGPFLAELERKLDEDSSSLMAHTLAGNYFFFHDQPQIAEKEFRLVLSKDPDNAMMYNNLANTLLRQGKIDEAVGLYKKAVKIDVNLGLAYCNWGYVMEAKSDLKEAIRLYLIAIKVAPGDAWPYNRLGVIEMKLGNKQKAIWYWKKGSRIDPSSESAKNLRALNIY